MVYDDKSNLWLSVCLLNQPQTDHFDVLLQSMALGLGSCGRVLERHGCARRLPSGRTREIADAEVSSGADRQKRQGEHDAHEPRWKICALPRLRWNVLRP